MPLGVKRKKEKKEKGNNCPNNCQELTDSCPQKQKEGVSTLLQFSVY
jgi:hypothetical protein